MARVRVFGGSTGYHRFRLFNAFVNNFREWWLVGTKYTDHWGFGMQDLTNQFVVYGARGGLLSVVLFLVILALAFREVGRAVDQAGNDRSSAFLAWTIGAMLFGHCVTFLGYSYWDQIIVLWYLSLAMAASATRLTAADEEVRQPESNPALTPVAEMA
jgi:Na+-transporting methylmalonyl-CoA/oxaloacetate decarboxylase gamma subunit